MQKFTDMHGRIICDGAEVYFNGAFPNEVPPTKHIRDGIAIIEGDKLVFAVYINDQLQGIGLYWDFDNEPCYDLIISEGELSMHKIFKLLNTICSQRGKLAEIDRDGLPHELHDRIMHVSSLHGYVVDAMESHTETLEYVERTLAYIDEEIEEIFNALPTIIIYRSITAEIFKGSKGHECKVTDRHGNVLRWFLYADSMPHAIAKAERSFDSAIACLRGFTTTGEFFGRMYGYYV